MWHCDICCCITREERSLCGTVLEVHLHREQMDIWLCMMHRHRNVCRCACALVAADRVLEHRACRAFLVSLSVSFVNLAKGDITVSKQTTTSAACLSYTNHTPVVMLCSDAYLYHIMLFCSRLDHVYGSSTAVQLLPFWEAKHLVPSPWHVPRR